MSTPIDLWPSDVQMEILSPKLLLIQHGKILERRTKGLIRGEVTTRTSNGLLYCFFDIFSSVLASRTRLVEVRSKPTAPYPCEVFASVDPNHPGLAGLTHRPIKNGTTSESESMNPEVTRYEANTEKEFIDLLRVILGSDQTAAVLNSLIAQINESRSEQILSASPTEDLTQDAEG